MHEESAVTFECGKCKQIFKTGNTWKIHEKNCKTSLPPRKRETPVQYATRPPQNQTSQDTGEAVTKEGLSRVMESKTTKPEVAKPKIKNLNHENTNQLTQNAPSADSNAARPI